MGEARPVSGTYTRTDIPRLLMYAVPGYNTWLSLASVNGPPTGYLGTNTYFGFLQFLAPPPTTVTLQRRSLPHLLFDTTFIGYL
jgi:hypothetical protein